MEHVGFINIGKLNLAALVYLFIKIKINEFDTLNKTISLIYTQVDSQYSQYNKLN